MPVRLGHWQNKRNDRAMIRQICNVRAQDIVTTRSSELLARLGIEDLGLILKERRLRWYGHVECSNGAVKTAFHIQIEKTCGPGRSKMTWKQLTERDYREWKLSAINPHDSNMWRSGLRYAMRAASQLSGMGPTDVAVAPVPARLIKNPIMMMMMSHIAWKTLQIKEQDIFYC